MNRKTYCLLSATLFTIVALAHLARVLNGWPVNVGTMEVPQFVSWFGFAGPGALAFLGFRAAAAGDT